MPKERLTLKSTTWGLVIVIAASALSAGCQTHTGSVAKQPSIRFLEGVSVGVPVDKAGNARLGDGAVGSVRIANEGTTAVRIIRIQPRGDSGLGIQYVGHSNCRNGCPGAEMYTVDTRRLLARTVEGLYPINVAAGSDQVWLIFRLQTISAEASVL